LDWGFHGFGGKLSIVDGQLSIVNGRAAAGAVGLPEVGGAECLILADFLKNCGTFWFYVKAVEWRAWNLLT
jgi:hypothetical protein